MFELGVIEGFFGPQWSLPARESYASFLAKTGGTFYIYAPKQDPQLRKKWREEWSPDYLSGLNHLKEVFHQSHIKFGVGLSPFGLGTILSNEDKKLLRSKMKLLSELRIDLLGLFFDDMPTNDHLAATQVEALNFIRESFSGKIIFCPSYYTPDPILDKVFGPRPANYLQEIGDNISLDVSIAWTGPKVISPELPQDHLEETTEVLKRQPFLWENIFANDGPKNCKFLKLKEFSGRSSKTPSSIEGMGLNLMNQPELSKILFLSAKKVLLDGKDPKDAFEASLDETVSSEFKTFILLHHELFSSQGLDHISEAQKEDLLRELSGFSDPGAQDVRDWLLGKYIVGSECLTD
jgi:hypothetical protein